MKYIFCMMAFLTLAAAPLRAQWEPTNGPLQGRVRVISVNGADIFAGTEKGVFLSTDNGANWIERNVGLLNNDIYSLVISGENIFVGTASAAGRGGVFLSSDRAANWTMLNNINPYFGYDVSALKVEGDTIFAGTSIGLAYSTNKGATWLGNGPIGSGTIYSIATMGSFRFVGTDSGAFRITNDGNAWIKLTSLPPWTVRALTISDTTIFAGVSWAGMYASTNIGWTWSICNFGVEQIYAISKIGKTLFAGIGFRGILISTDNGKNWTAINTGLKDSTFYSLAFNNKYIFAGSDSIVWRRPLSDFGIEDVKIIEQNPAFSLYPNPSDGMITIQTFEQISKITIFDEQGKEIIIQPGDIHTEPGEVKINIHGLSSGEYVCNVFGKSEVRNIKFIKK